MKRRFFLGASTLVLRRARSFSAVVQRRKHEFLIIRISTRAFRPETRHWSTRDKFAPACHEPLFGWRGVRLIEKLSVTWAPVEGRPGFTFTTRRILITHATGRGTHISGLLCTIRFIIGTFRQLSLILARSLLSPTAGLSPSITWLRASTNQKFCRVLREDESV